ncbi:MAG TPA: CoA-transferase [Chloroflexia bacterium]|nr:CoA-transferase [Chloroflexia bacterium]
MSDDYKPVLRAGSDPVVFFKYPGAGDAGNISTGQVMVSALSRSLRDGEVVVMGANSMIPLAAARLAQLTHAPNLTILAGASGAVNTLVEPLVPSSGDYANLVAEAVLPFPEVLMLQLGGRTDVFFVGGLQIDRHGNCNLALVGDRERPTLRGPGSAAIAWAARSGRAILYTTSHTPRVFVPRVDFVSLAGWTEPGERWGGIGAEPAMVVTPLAVMDFSQDGLMRLVSTHPGVSMDKVVENTGFDLIMPEGEVPATPEPTPEELRLMRDFDVDGLLALVV